MNDPNVKHCYVSSPLRLDQRRAPSALSGAVVCISGTLSKGRALIEADIKAHGGKVAGSITKQCTHLVTTPAEFAGQTTKVKDALAKDVPLVTEDWLDASVAKGALADDSLYGVGTCNAPAPAPAPAKAPPKKAAAAPKKPKAAAAPKAPKAAPKAPKAAPASTSSAAPPSIIPVDQGLIDARKLGGQISVHGGFSFLGNQVERRAKRSKARVRGGLLKTVLSAPLPRTRSFERFRN